MAKRNATDATTLGRLGEEGFLRSLERRLPASGEGLLRGIGDDAAVLAPTGDARQVFTSDLLIEGTHFTTDTLGDARRLGRKAVAANASDVASMGAVPTSFVVGLAAPPSTPMRFIDDLVRGLLDASRRYGVPMAGGDTTRGESLTIAVAMIGRLDGDAPPATRDAARPGQTLFVSGWPGESGAGLALLKGDLRPPADSFPATRRRRLVQRHQDPTARVELGCALRAFAAEDGLAMVDVSDGVAHEAGLLARASGVAVEIETSRLPRSRALRRLADATGFDIERFVLHGGEDFELLFTCERDPDTLRRALKESAAEDASRKTRRSVPPAPVHAIGRVVEGEGVWLIDADGRRAPLRPEGYEHFG